MELDLEDVPVEGYPALYGHCTTMWQAMFDKSKPYEDGEYRLYEGFLTGLFKEHGLSVPYYTTVMNVMKEMGCVQQLKRGGGAGKSEWLLLEPPSFEKFQVAHEQLQRAGSVRSSAREMTQQQLRDLASRISNVEERLTKAGL